MALIPIKTRSADQSGDTKAPRPSAEDEILIREIDDAVRQDDATQFVQKYGIALGSAIALLIAGLGGYLIWDGQKEGWMESESETLISGLDFAGADDFKSANEKVEPLIADGGPGARTAARFLQAGVALEQGDTNKAVELYAAIVADPGAPAALRDLARIREVAANFDERDAADIIAKLKDLAIPGNPFFGSAAELTAMAHLEAGRRDEAGRLFGDIAKDEDLPETLRSRARQMAGLLGFDAIDDVEQLLRDEGVGTPVGDGAPAPFAQ